MKCPKCDGKGFEEFEHGLIQVKCEECNGTGEIDDKPGENGDDLRSSSGDDLSHPTTGSPDTSEPEQPSKQTKRKGTTKRPRKTV